MTQQLLLGCGIITAMLGAVAALIKAGVWSWRIARKLGHMADDLTGEPARPGHEATPGVLERLAGIEGGVALLSQLPARVDAMEMSLGELKARLVAVEVQMHPNGGSTLRDAVDRLQPTEAAAP